MHKLARAWSIPVPFMLLSAAMPLTASATGGIPTAGQQAETDPEAAVEVDAQALRATVTARLPQVTRCYERELKRTPGLEGRLEVRFTIGGDGGVVWSGVGQDSIGSPDLARCVATQFRTFRFRGLGLSEGQQVTVVYPLVFTKTQAAAS